MATATVFRSYVKARNEGNAVNFTTATLLLVLLTDAAIGNLNDAANGAGSDFLSDLTAYEVTGTNYARKTLSGVTPGMSSGVYTVGASDPTAYAQSGAGFTNARFAVLVADGANDAARRLIQYWDLGANVGNVAGPLTLDLDTNELLSDA